MNCFVNVVPLLSSTPAYNLRLRLYYQKNRNEKREEHLFEMCCCVIL